MKLVAQKDMCIVAFVSCSQRLLTCANTYLNSTLAVNNPSEMAVCNNHPVVTSKPTSTINLSNQSGLLFLTLLQSRLCSRHSKDQDSPLP